MQTVSIIKQVDIEELESISIQNGLLVPMPFHFYTKFTSNQIAFFCWKYGIYVVPTTELIEYLQTQIIGKAIEIGCGNGAIGRALNIPITDSKLQENNAIQAMYKAMNQPTITYPKDVIQLDALSAIKEYKPQTVIGAFITHKYSPKIKSGNMYGVVEGKILQQVDKYIHIGNLNTHKDKPILKHKHEQLYFDWLITRSQDQSKNRIYVWH